MLTRLTAARITERMRSTEPLFDCALLAHTYVLCSRGAKGNCPKSLKVAGDAERVRTVRVFDTVQKQAIYWTPDLFADT